MYNFLSKNLITFSQTHSHSLFTKNDASERHYSAPAAEQIGMVATREGQRGRDRERQNEQEWKMMT